MRKAAVIAREKNRQEYVLNPETAADLEEDLKDETYIDSSNKKKKFPKNSQTKPPKGINLSDDEDEVPDIKIATPKTKETTPEDVSSLPLMRKIKSKEEAKIVTPIRRFSSHRLSLGKLNSLMNPSNKRKSSTFQSSSVKPFKLSSIQTPKSEVSSESAVKALKDLEGNKDFEQVKFGNTTVLVESNKKSKEKTGIASVLNKIKGVKRSINTLEKSSIDWEKFKKEGKVEVSELKKFKETGYVEKQLFMQRVDQRMFEQERKQREILREYRDSQKH